MEQDHHQEMHLLSSSMMNHRHHHHPPPPRWAGRALEGQFQGPSLDLQLSISVTSTDHPFKAPSAETLKWEAAEQIRLAAMEKAYAEHVMELSRREIEAAQSEFLRARSLWERAREEVERAEKMREGSNACMDTEREITCFSCRTKFRP